LKAARTKLRIFKSGGRSIRVSQIRQQSIQVGNKLQVPGVASDIAGCFGGQSPGRRPAAVFKVNIDTGGLYQAFQRPTLTAGRRMPKPFQKLVHFEHESVVPDDQQLQSGILKLGSENLFKDMIVN
jgi:hypothetical protein